MNFNNTAKVGFFTFFVLMVLATIISWKSDIFLMRDGQEVVGSFTNIEGLTIGSEVRYRGFPIGKVTKIDPNPSDIKVYALVKKDIIVPDNSHLRVGFDGIVGLKYLEIRPGTSETVYAEGTTLLGISTAGIVDFVDIGAQNLVETKRILIALRNVVEDPKLQMAFKDAVFTADKAAIDVEKLVNEIRETNNGIKKITTDSEFQNSVKGMAKETNKTLTSANRFFDSFGKLNLKPSADIQYGSIANTVRANMDIVSTLTDYLRIGIGEGPTRNLSLLDVLLSRRVYSDFGIRLGMINTYLGGGLEIFPTEKLILSGDLYDFNNPKPNSPKIRATMAYRLYEYSDILLQADDIFNSARNYSFGVRVKGVGD